MAILAYDEVMLREPRLLVPRMQPLGQVRPDPAHPLARSLRHCWIGSRGMRDLVGQWHLSFAGSASLRPDASGVAFDFAAGSDTANIDGAPVTWSQRFLWLGVARIDTNNISVFGPAGNGYVDGGYVLGRWNGTADYYTANGGGNSKWTSSAYTLGTWATWSVHVGAADFPVLWINGASLGNGSLAMAGTPAYRRLCGITSYNFDGAIALSALWDGVVPSDAQLKSLHNDPYQFLIPA